MPKKPKKESHPSTEPQIKYSNPPQSLSERLAPDGPSPTTDWLEKNAHARAIILSTLIPGSEPWKIAEPLEYASDIWKALEDRYAPKSDSGGNRLERADFVNDWVEGRDIKKYRDGPKQGVMLKDFPPDALNPRMSSQITNNQLQDVMMDRTMHVRPTQKITMMNEEDDRKSQEQRKKEANAAAAKVMAEHMPNRDQRFLWALLHGGKEETMNWFNGTIAGANTT